MKSMGERIKEMREKMGYSQDEITQKMGKKHRNTISSWENDKAEPSLTDLRKLAEILNTTLPYLTDGIEEGAGNEVPAGYIIKSATEELKDKQRIIDMQAMIVEMQAKQLKEHKALP